MVFTDDSGLLEQLFAKTQYETAMTVFIRNDNTAGLRNENDSLISSIEAKRTGDSFSETPEHVPKVLKAQLPHGSLQRRNCGKD
jgi:hypothetical protein